MNQEIRWNSKIIYVTLCRKIKGFGENNILKNKTILFYLSIGQLISLISRISQKKANNNSHDNTRKSTYDIHGSPTIASNICLRHIKAQNKGQTVTIVDTPRKNSVGQTSSGWTEQFKEYTASHWPTYSFAYEMVMRSKCFLFNLNTQKRK